MGFDGILGLRMVRPAGPFDFDRIGDDIVARAASDFAKSQDSRIEGIDTAADDGLGRRQELGGCDDGVDALCGMAAWLALPLRTMRIWSEAAIIGPGRTPILPLGSVGQT